MDVVGAFLGECCVLAEEADVSAGDLYRAYGEWCKDTGETQEKQRRFGSRLTERGCFERYRGGKNGGHMWRGLDLLTHWKFRICRDSDPSDVKTPISDSEKALHGINSTSGSDGSAETPVSSTTKPRKPVTVDDDFEEELAAVRDLFESDEGGSE